MTLHFVNKIVMADPNPGGGGEIFGSACDICGVWAVVGCPAKDEPPGDWSTYPGAAYVFKLENGTWIEKQKLSSDAPANGAEFGLAVAIDEDTIAVTEPGRSNGGYVHVYTRSGDTWSVQQRFAGSDTAVGDYFGSDVSVSGDNLVVGAPSDDDNGSAAGTAFVFTRTGGTWSQQQKIQHTSPSANDRFGTKVCIDGSGDTLISGSAGFDDTYSDEGQAWIFTRSGAVWTQQQAIPHPAPAAGYGFGYDVWVEGDEAAISTIGEDAPLSNVGACYFFTRSGSVWSQQQRLQPDSAATQASMEFGRSIDFSNGQGIVGARGDEDGSQPGIRGSFYHVTKVGAVWEVTERIYPDLPIWFGYSVALDASSAPARFICGGPQEDFDPVYGPYATGSARLYSGPSGDESSFETAGPSPGQADGWTIEHPDGAERIAPFDGSVLPFDDFEAGWNGGNQISREEFEDSDLAAATYNDATATIEKFDWEWRTPAIAGYFTVGDDSGYTVGKHYRDKTYGGRALCVGKPGANRINVLLVDHVNPGSSGFAQLVALPEYPTLSVLAELNYNYHLIGVGDGYIRTFGATLPNTPVHEEAASITVKIGEETYTIVDDGAGNLTGTPLDTAGNNTVNYTTGVVALAFLTAPASGQKIECRYEWGAEVSSPAMPDGAFQVSQIPPWNHTSLEEFTATDLVQGIAETYESSWLSNENWQASFDPADLTAAQFDSATEDYEDFEEDWWDNDDWQATFSGGDLTAATFDTTPENYEDFEEEWTTLLQV